MEDRGIETDAWRVLSTNGIYNGELTWWMRDDVKLVMDTTFDGDGIN